MSRKNARIYRKAARVLFDNEGEFSCNQIGRVSGWKDANLINNYRELYELGDGLANNPNCSDLWLDKLENKQNRRLLMLLFAAAIENTGGLLEHQSKGKR